MKRSEFAFDSVDLLYYKLRKISLNHRIIHRCCQMVKKKKATINTKNNDNKCFQRAITVLLNHEQNKNDLERILNVKPFIKLSIT